MRQISHFNYSSDMVLSHSLSPIVHVGLIYVLVLLAVGCRGQTFDPDEELPTYPGVVSELHVIQSKERGILLVEKIKNQSNRDINVFISPAFQAFRLVVTDSDGDEVSLGQYGRQAKESGLNRPNVGSTIIFSGKSSEREFPLSLGFDLSEPGIYTAEVASRFRFHNSKPDDPQYFATDPEPITFKVK